MMKNGLLKLSGVLIIIVLLIGIFHQDIINAWLTLEIYLEDLFGRF